MQARCDFAARIRVAFSRTNSIYRRMATMPTTAIHASRILTPDDEISDGVIVVEGSRIAAIGHRDEMRLPPDASISLPRA